MANHIAEHRTIARPSLRYMRDAGPSGHAFSVLYLGYIALPLIAGADKFYHALTDWTQYLAPQATALTGLTAGTFMRMVGVIEIAAGVLVAVRPRLGAPVVGAWLLGIIVNLIMLGGYYDIALRDFGLAVGAYALWQLSGRRVA